MHPSPPTRAVRAGAVLVRLPAVGAEWTATLPSVPGTSVLTVTLGHPDLLPAVPDDLLDRGYRIVGVAAEHRPIGHKVDVLVPGELRAAQPDWWAQLLERAERVFDLRHGPVLRLLAAELDLHLRAHAG